MLLLLFRCSEQGVLAQPGFWEQAGRDSSGAVAVPLLGADLYSMNPRHLKTRLSLWLIRKGDDIKVS